MFVVKRYHTFLVQKKKKRKNNDGKYTSNIAFPFIVNDAAELTAKHIHTTRRPHWRLDMLLGKVLERVRASSCCTNDERESYIHVYTVSPERCTHTQRRLPASSILGMPEVTSATWKTRTALLSPRSFMQNSLARCNVVNHLGKTTKYQAVSLSLVSHVAQTWGGSRLQRERQQWRSDSWVAFYRLD